jgi:regulator of protease activity HflC (stomatin/prohibitin superfamily)
LGKDKRTNWASFALLPVVAFFIWVILNGFLNIFLFSSDFFKNSENSWLVPSIQFSLFVLIVWGGISGARIKPFIPPKNGTEPEGTGEVWNFAVPPGYCALLTIMDMRIGNFFFVSEGPFWWLPHPFGTVKLFDLREFGVTISEKTVPTKDTVDVGIEIEIRAKITDPYKFIEQSGIFLPADKDGSFEKLAHSALRSYVQSKKVDELVDSVRGTELAEAIKREFSPGSKDWGVEIVNIFYRDLNLPQKILDAAARVPTEERSRRADKIKRENLVENAIAIATELGMTRKDAALMFQAEQGDMNVQQNRVVIDGIDDILKVVRENTPALVDAFTERLKGGRRIIT